MPPSDGPHHGARDITTSDTSSKRTPLAVYSRPFVLTSTEAYPTDEADDDDDDDDDALHASAPSLTYAAGTTVAFNRQRSPPHASAAAEKPPPSTVSGVPPSTKPRTGHTDDTHADERYVNDTPLTENC